MTPERSSASGPRPSGDVDAILDALLADAPPTVAGRPRTIGVMVVAANGWATLEGRSGGLSSPADRAVFRGLRERADALLVGSVTLNRERYSTVLDAHQRKAREARGRSPEPIVATVSKSLRLDDDLPLLHAAENQALIYTESDRTLEVDPRRAEVVRLAEATHAAALADLARRGAVTVNCEGGPTTLGVLVRDGLLGELVLTVAPILVGGESPLTAVAGFLGARSVGLELRRTWSTDGVVFAHYRVGAGESS